MNIALAKTISMSSFLAALGYSPARTGSQPDEFWYYSPFREEKTPSFKLKADHIWYDHGIGEGGTIIDFVKQYRKTESISEVLDFLSDYERVNGQHMRAATRKRDKRNQDRQIQIINAKMLTDHRLSYYLRSERHITLQIAKQHLRQIEFSIGETVHQAVGFANRSGGWELRNRYFKGSSSPKDMSLIKSVYNPHSRLAVFEGFMDYLSLLTLLDRKHLACDVMVLNSVALAGRAVEYVIKQDYQDLYTYFDNDDAGKKANNMFTCLACPVYPQNERYAPHKDLNAFLVHSRSNQPSR